MARGVDLRYSPAQINWAGRVIRSMFLVTNTFLEPGDINSAFEIADNFRAAHQFPLNTLYMTLRNRAGSGSINSQRTKRMPSIVDKLVLRENMRLTEMQDIGGCRSVVPTLRDVYRLRDLYRNHPVALPSGDRPEVDYILEPRDDTGYRSLHLKYRFKGTEKSQQYDGLRIEIQIRTHAQHQWATAVEAAATFTNKALKVNVGDEHWLRFFRLMSSVLALQEGTPSVPGTPETFVELRDEIRDLNARHHLVAAFEQYSNVITRMEAERWSHFFLLLLDPTKPELLVKGFKESEYQRAFEEYRSVEAEIGAGGPKQVVLVSTRNLRRAYPNYFLNTQAFLALVRPLLG